VVTEGVGKIRPDAVVKPIVTAAVASAPAAAPSPAAPKK
jgi:hypothetical protein